MSSLFDALRDLKVQDNSLNINSPSTKSKMKGPFAAKVEKWTDDIVKDYYAYHTDLNQLIGKVAEKNNLSNEQISRIIEEVNSEIYLIEYDKLKNLPNREVNFMIADLTKIKDIMGNNTKANQQPAKEPGTGGVDQKMDKKASILSDGKEDKLDFLNSTSYDTIGLSEDKKVTARQLMERAILPKIASIVREAKEAEEEYTSEVLCMAEALIGYEKLGCDAASIFEEVCNESQLLKKYQLPIIDAVMGKIARSVESRILPKSFSIALKPVDYTEKVAGLSLGKYSLIKTADESMNNSNKKLPNVKTDKQLVKGYNDLVRIAKKIQDAHNAAEAAAERQKKIASILE